MPSPTIESFRRIRGRNLSAHFYDALLASDTEIQRHFAKANFDRQHDLFQHGLLMLLEYSRGSSVGRIAMQRLAEMHGRGRLNIAPHLYRNWIECLVATVAALDPEYDAELERAWRHDLERGIAFLKESHVSGAALVRATGS